MFKCSFLILVFLYLLPHNSVAQKISLKGIVVDSTGNMRLNNVSIVVLQANDSFIVADTRSASDGSFIINNISNGLYVVLFTCPGYADFSKKIEVDVITKKTLNLNTIGLLAKAILLKEVVIKSQVSAIKIKGDTTEFKADSFKVQANASVEELLKQLPSIQIDQSGNITAQGRRVKTVLVDGEEFFGNDPLLVTRNLRADMINKVQIYDKKSDEAAFTGINDGVKNKTINLKLKEDKKRGYFGKVNAGVGTEKFYNAQGMFNLFQDKRKLAAFLTTSNIGLSGLAKDDKDRFGSDESGDGNYDGKGIPKITSGGAHFDDKWDDIQQSINGNVKLNYSSLDEANTNFIENNLPTGIQRSEKFSTSQNTLFKNQYNFTYINKYNSTSTLKIYTDASLENSTSRDTSNYNNRAGDNILLLKNNTNRSFKNTYNVFNLNIDWQKKFKKDGRTFSSYLKGNYSNYDAKGNSFSENTFFSGSGTMDSVKTLDFRKTDERSNKNISLTMIYTEPLSKRLSMALNYNWSNINNNDNRSSLNKDSSGQYNQLDTVFSNHFEANQMINKFGASFNYNNKNLIAKIGNNWGLVRFRMTDVYDDALLKRTFTIWEPNATFTYKFSDFKIIELNYNGNTNQPTRNQLQPSRYNNDLLNTYLPNSDIQTSFTNNINLVFSKYMTISESYLSLTANYTLTSDPITAIVQANPSGTYTYQYENLFDHSNKDYTLSILYSRKLKSINAQIYGLSSITNSNSFSMVNNDLNKLNNNSYNFQFGLNKTIPAKYSLNLVNSIGYNMNRFSIQKELNNNYLNFTINPSADIFITKEIQLHTDGNYVWQQKTQAFDKNFERFVWNAWLGKTFLKKEQLLIKIACNDILNKNIGFSRIATGSYVSQNTYKTIQRFFMLSAVWNFNHFNSIKQ